VFWGLVNLTQTVTALYVVALTWMPGVVCPIVVVAALVAVVFWVKRGDVPVDESSLATP
jgi:hypothetical protein